MFSVRLALQMCYCSRFIGPCLEVNAINPMLEMRKLRYREVTCPRPHSRIGCRAGMFLQSDSRYTNTEARPPPEGKCSVFVV